MSIMPALSHMSNRRVWLITRQWACGMDKTLIHLGWWLPHMGTKSLEFSFQIEESSTGMALARGKVVMVAYDPEGERSIPIPPAWREKINLFEKREERNDTA